MTHDQGVRAGEDLLDAITWFRDQELSFSSVERLVARVEQIGLHLRASNVVELAHSVRVDLVDQLRDPVEGEPRRSVR